MHPAERRVRKLLKANGYTGVLRAAPKDEHDPEHGRICLLSPNEMDIFKFGYKFNGGNPAWFCMHRPLNFMRIPSFRVEPQTTLEQLSEAQDEDGE